MISHRTKTIPLKVKAATYLGVSGETSSVEDRPDFDVDIDEVGQRCGEEPIKPGCP